VKRNQGAFESPKPRTDFNKSFFLQFIDMAQTEDLEKWRAQLMECKQLDENDIKKLCDKV
jgi:hypothetical protein